jgi:thiamine-phosphate pyrophosphorylase
MGFDRGSHGVLCLVTDRRRLAARLARRAEASACLVDHVKGAAAAGVDLIHLRERDLPARHLLELASACVRAVGGTGTRIVVNDRVDVALAAGASGVHLRGDSVPSSLVRASVPAGFLIGRSVHSVAEAAAEAAAGAIDYLVLGTMFPTASKPTGETVIGPDALQRVVEAVAVPVLGIGGVTAANLPALAATGAAGFAAIGWFIEAYCDGRAGRDFSDRVAWARQLFDTPGSMP